MVPLLKLVETASASDDDDEVVNPVGSSDVRLAMTGSAADREVAPVANGVDVVLVKVGLPVANGVDVVLVKVGSSTAVLLAVGKGTNGLLVNVGSFTAVPLLAVGNSDEVLLLLMGPMVKVLVPVENAVPRMVALLMGDTIGDPIGYGLSVVVYAMVDVNVAPADTPVYVVKPVEYTGG